MEVLFDLRTVFGAEQPIAKIAPEWIMMRNARKFPAIADVINALGEESAKAQGLRTPVTSYEKMFNTDYTLYIWWEPHPTKKGYSLVLGLAKVGFKDLYLFDREGTCHKCRPLCLLDFYVVQSQQRRGYGIGLYNHVMQENGIKHPWEVPVDSPSSIYYMFMNRHFGLPRSSAIEQPNNFVVFSKFFNPNEIVKRSDSPMRQPQTQSANAQSSPFRPHPHEMGNRHAFVRRPGEEAAPSSYVTAKSRYLTNLNHSPAW